MGSALDVTYIQIQGVRKGRLLAAQYPNGGRWKGLKLLHHEGHILVRLRDACHVPGENEVDDVSTERRRIGKLDIEINGVVCETVGQVCPSAASDADLRSAALLK